VCVGVGWRCWSVINCHNSRTTLQFSHLFTKTVNVCVQKSQTYQAVSGPYLIEGLWDQPQNAHLENVEQYFSISVQLKWLFSSPETFSKHIRKAFAAGAVLRNPLGELTTPSQTPNQLRRGHPSQFQCRRRFQRPVLGDFGASFQ